MLCESFVAAAWLLHLVRSCGGLVGECEVVAHCAQIHPLVAGDQIQRWLDVRLLYLLCLLFSLSLTVGGGDHLDLYWPATPAAALCQVVLCFFLAWRYARVR